MKKIKSMLAPLIVGSLVVTASFLFVSCSTVKSFNYLKSIKNKSNADNFVAVDVNLDEVFKSDELKLKVLNNFFDGLNEENIVYINVTLSSKDKIEIGDENKFVLESIDKNFNFSNDSVIIESNLFTVKGRVKLSSKSEDVVSKEEIFIGFLNDYDKNLKPVNKYMLPTLQKLFENINEINMPYLLVKINQNNGKRIITLVANENENYIFSINGIDSNELSSELFEPIDKPVVLNIKQNPLFKSLTSLQISSINSKALSLSVLKDIFSNVDEHIINYISDYSLENIDNKQMLRITLKSGFLFLNDTNMLKSTSFSATVLDSVNQTSVSKFFESGGIWEGKTKFTKEDLVGVETIGPKAFFERGLTSFEFPDTVREISFDSFKNNLLTKIIIPPDILLIGDSAFSNNALKNIVISNSVTSIGNYAFANNALTKLDIPASVTIIGTNAFENNLLSSLVVPNTVTRIGKSAFNKNILNNLIMPDSMNSIDDFVFANNKLSEIILPMDLKTIGKNAFENNLLSSLTLPNSVTTISSNAFSYNEIKTLTLSNTLNRIDANAFSNNKLTYIEIPHSLKVMGIHAFSGNEFSSHSDIVWIDGNDLSDSMKWDEMFGSIITDPKKYDLSLKEKPTLNSNEIVNDHLTISMLESVFEGTITNELLEDIESYEIKEDGNVKRMSITLKSGAVFRKGLRTLNSNPLIIKDVLILDKPTVDKYFSSGGIWEGKKEFTKKDLNGVVAIRTKAFSNRGLKTLEMPNSIIIIEEEAFSNNNLTKIVFSNELKKIEDQTFSNNKISKITIPNGIEFIGVGAFVKNKFISIKDITIENKTLLGSVNWEESFGLQSIQKSFSDKLKKISFNLLK